MPARGSILIVDDNEDILFSLKLLLSKHFEHIRTERNPNIIQGILARERYDLYLLDMNFSAGVSSGNEGIFWMKKILQVDPSAVVVFITAYGDVELAVKALKEGATDFIQKPWEKEKLLTTLRNAYRIRASDAEIDRLTQQKQHLSRDLARTYDLVLGPGQAMRTLMNMVAKVAVTDANVLILGENGTGKEIVAREIHRLSQRSQEIFVPVDMGALSGTLFESELFGHLRGSFTGASDDRAGRFELASNGTLFLDEIGNLPLDLQSKLLTVLQRREVVRLGSNTPVAVDIRLISASNRPLHRIVEEGHFREDLLYRINTIQIEVPPLRERREDIPALIRFFLDRYGRKYGHPKLEITEREIQRLQQYHWPGNVRELQHYIEKAVILCEGERLALEEPFLGQGEGPDDPASG
ncbi:MAG TPA: sigma-54 dependent transcriptional regulator, partial [Bacteroidales bacterium]|nr:sigma-54 dependent transcriptional regulator [Bacteroidales bacterium]